MITHETLSRREILAGSAIGAATLFQSAEPAAAADGKNTFTDSAAGTILANLVTDSSRKATKADIGCTANGLVRSGLPRGKSGVQTVYDLFAVAPLGDGIVDTTAGSVGSQPSHVGCYGQWWYLLGRQSEPRFGRDPGCRWIRTTDGIGAPVQSESGVGAAAVRPQISSCSKHESAGVRRDRRSLPQRDGR